MTEASLAGVPSSPASPASGDGRGVPWRALAWAVGALVVACVLAGTFPLWRYDVPYGVMLTATYVLTWGPLVIALIATVAFWRSFLGFRAVDIYLGLLVGVVARAVGILIQFFLTGQLPSSSLMIGGITAVYVFTSVIAPVVLAPLIEEPFFRGLLQGALGRVLRPWTSVVITALVFALVHTITDGWSWVALVTLLVYSLLAGYATQQTKRIGAAVVGHATFNGLAALISWPW